MSAPPIPVRRSKADIRRHRVRLAAGSVKRVVRTHLHIKTGWCSVWRVAYRWMAAASNGYAADDGASNLWLGNSGSLRVTFVVPNDALAGINASANTTAVTTSTIIFIAILPAIANIRKNLNSRGPNKRSTTDKDRRASHRRVLSSLLSVTGAFGRPVRIVNLIGHALSPSRGLEAVIGSAV